MTAGEFKEIIAELKEAGYTDQMLLIGLYSMYSNNEFTTEEYEILVNILGYELTDEFKNMSEEDKHNVRLEYEDDDED